MKAIDPKRTIFPVLLDHTERKLLRQLSTESEQSQSEVVRQLIYREFATRRLRPVAVSQKDGSQ